MKKIQKSIILTAFMFILLFNSFTMKAESNTFEEDAFSVESVEGGVRITKYIGEDKEIINPVFPDFINGEKLVEIGDDVFAGNQKLNGTLTLGQHVKKIGTSAFRDTKIERVIAPSVEIIEEEAFAGSEVKELSFPQLEVIGDKAFSWTQLEKLEAKNLKELGAWSLEHSNLKTLQFEELQTIGEGAFAGLDLKELHLGQVE